MTFTAEYLLIVLGLLGSIASILLFMLSYVRRKSDMKRNERYDFDRHMVELEYMRKNMEMQLYDISRKLEENDRRWRDMNHLVVSTQNKFESTNVLKSEVAPNEFLTSFGITNQKEFEIDNRLVFVLTPFNDNYRRTFISIREVCSHLGLNCVRGDEEYIPNEIFPSIIRQIIRSRLIIANISGRNPNVMYELGVAHALGKPTLIVAQDFTDIPFDLNNKRIILFKTEEDLQRKLEMSINDMLINRY